MRPVSLPRWVSLPVSSSMCARSISTRQVLPSSSGTSRIAVDRDRLVVLGDLVVLRHVRVEVVLPGEPAPRHDLAVQDQPDPDRRLHRGLVEHRQRTRQTQTHRAHLGIGFGAELGGAAAEHLGGGGQLDVHLQAEYRLVARDDIVVVEQFRTGRLGSARSRSHALDPNWRPKPPPRRRRRQYAHRRSATYGQRPTATRRFCRARRRSLRQSAEPAGAASHCFPEIAT